MKEFLPLTDCIFG